MDGVPIGTTSSALGLKIFAIIARIKNYKSIIKKKEKEAWSNSIAQLNNVEILISKALNDWYISHDEFVLLNDVLKECDEMKGEIKN